MSRRILAAMMALTALLLVGIVVPLGQSAIAHDRQVFTDRVIAEAEAVSSLAEEHLADDQALGALTPATVATVTPPGSSVAVFDTTGAVVQTLGPAPPVSPLQVAAALAGHPVVAATESRILVIAAVRSGSLVVGATALARGTASLEREVRALRITLALAGLAALGAAAALSLALARWVGRPLRRLDRAVASLGRGEMSARSRVSAGPPEVRELAATFDDMAARLQTLLDSHRNLVADVSHQLRTPLAAVRLRLELLTGDLAAASPAGDQLRDGHPVRELEGALVELARLSRLVDGLLAVARAEHTLPAPARVELCELARERADAWAPLAAERGVHLAADAPGSVAASVTPGHLEQVLDNLVANALDATPAGGSVTIRCSVVGGAPTVQVRDSGPGMTEDARRNAFHRFWSDPAASDAGAPTGGTGLGLAIVHRLVTGDGGEVLLEDAPGGGLLVSIRLRPARLDAAVRTPSPSGARSGAR